MLKIREEKIEEIDNLKEKVNTPEEHLLLSIFGYDTFKDENAQCTNEENILRFCKFYGLNYKDLQNIVSSPTTYVLKEQLCDAYIAYAYKKDKKNIVPSEKEKSMMLRTLYNRTHFNSDKYFNIKLIKKIGKEFYLNQRDRYTFI